MNRDFNTIKKNIKKDYHGFKRIKLALLGDSATQLLNVALRGCAFEDKIDLEVFESDYDQIERLILDTTSPLYTFMPDFIVVFRSTRKLQQQFYKLPAGLAQGLSQTHLEFLEKAYSAVTSSLSARIIYLNFYETDDREFGNFSNKTAASFLYQLRKINLDLMNFSQDHGNFLVCDLSYLVTRAGARTVVDEKFYISADMAFTPDFWVVIAENVLDIVKGSLGRITKCVILDLDNTLWGGIIGDDGLEKIEIGDYKMGKAFHQLQVLMRQLKERGIILAICSKNTESIAREPFEKHPDMVLRLNDFALFVANWENKVSNIRYIREVLDIGFDSMVFLDDNPVERDMVRQHIPEVIVPELPSDPAQYLNYLRDENLFETASFSLEDNNRTALYQVEADRKKYKMKFTDENDYLRGLEMECDVETVNSFSLPRVAQLTQRSNQFNLRTIRYSEEDLKKILSSERFFTLTFSLRDKFGEHGLICAIILEDKGNGTLFVDTWIMSCRVLKRGVENFVFNEIAAIAREKGFKIIVGEYIPTTKNGLVKGLYQDLGFTHCGDGWHYNLDHFKTEDIFIKKMVYDNGANN